MIDLEQIAYDAACRGFHFSLSRCLGNRTTLSAKWIARFNPFGNDDVWPYAEAETAEKAIRKAMSQLPKVDE